MNADVKRLLRFPSKCLKRRLFFPSKGSKIKPREESMQLVELLSDYEGGTFCLPVLN